MKIKPVLLAALTLCGTSLYAQEASLSYSSWLDSIQCKSYVAWEVTLDDLEIKEGKLRDHSLEEHYRENNSKDIDELLHHLPGIHTMRRGNFAGEALLRGLSSDRYVVSVEGMRMFGACTDKMDPISSYVEPINLQSIDLSFGGQSTMTGGGLNFNLRKPVFNAAKPYAASTTMVYNSVSNSFDPSADLNLSKDKLALRLSGVHRKANNYSDGNRNEVRFSQYEKFNYIASLSYRVKENHLLSFDFLGDDASNVGYPALPMDVAYARAKLFALTYLFPGTGWLQNPELKIYHNFIRHAMDDTKRDSVAMHMDMPGKTSTSGGFLKGDLISGRKSSLQFRADYFSTFAHAEMTMYPNETDGEEMFMLTWPDVHRRSGGISFDYRLSLNDRWALVSGLRMENSTSFISSEFGEQQLSTFGKSGVEKRNNWLQNYHVNVLWKPCKMAQTSLKIVYGERTPTVSEQYGYYLFNRLDNYDYMGDPDLKGENNLHLELAGEIKTADLTFSTAVFTYLFRDYIMGVYQPEYQAMTPGAYGIKFYENTESATMAGGELTSLYRFTPTSSLLLAMKYVYGEDYEGDPLPQMPPLKINLAVNQWVKGISILPEVEWSSARHRTSEKFNERETSSYWLCNLRLKKDLSWNASSSNSLLVFSPTTVVRFEIRGGIENIFNTAYREHYDIGDILRPGRNFYVQVKVGI